MVKKKEGHFDCLATDLTIANKPSQVSRHRITGYSILHQTWCSVGYKQVT